MAFASKVTIEIAGNKIPDFLYITINQNFNQLHTFQLVCRRDTFEQSGESPLSASIGKIGSVITFLIEDVNSGVNTKDFFFKGIITGISATESLLNQEIILSGNSPDILLHGYPTCRSFENMTLKQIVQEVLRPYPADQITLKGDPNNTHQYPYIVQYKETNYEFLRRLSVRFGEWFFYDGRDLVFGAFKKTSVKGVLGVNLMNFSIGARMAPLNFEYVSNLYGSNLRGADRSSSYDVTNCLNRIGKQAHDQSLNSYSEQATYYFPGTHLQNDGTYLPSTNTQDVVEKEKQKLASGMVVVNGSSYEPLQFGNVFQIKSVKIEKNSEIDVGEYLVTGLSHSIDNSMNYQNTFTAIPSEAKISPDTNVNAITRCENQSAVVKDRDDPQKLGRVRVKFLWQDDNQMTPWLRMATLNAGKGRGFFSVPELDEEVLVGFEGGDAEHPFILGSLYNGEATPHSEGKDLKNVKYLRSQKGSMIFFDEKDGNDRIVIRNGTEKDGNSIELELKEKYLAIVSTGDLYLHGKNIQMNSDENFTISAGKKMSIHTDDGGDDIVIKSAKAVSIKGTGGVNISGDTQIHGGNVTIKGDSKVSAEGASVSIDGKGSTEIKGGIVKIN